MTYLNYLSSAFEMNQCIKDPPEHVLVAVDDLLHLFAVAQQLQGHVTRLVVRVLKRPITIWFSMIKSGFTYQHFFFYVTKIFYYRF